MVTGDRDSYQYLVESIRRFPDQERFAAIIRNAAGFGQVKYRDLEHGRCRIAFRLAALNRARIAAWARQIPPLSTELAPGSRRSMVTSHSGGFLRGEPYGLQREA